MMRADYVTGSVTRLLGPGTGPGILLTPFRRAWQTLKGATKNVLHIVLGHHGSYPGLTGARPAILREHHLGGRGAR